MWVKYPTLMLRIQHGLPVSQASAATPANPVLVFVLSDASSESCEDCVLPSLRRFGLPQATALTPVTHRVTLAATRLPQVDICCLSQARTYGYRER